jgi:tetratricopeptide (TPR) repeat protein
LNNRITAAILAICGVLSCCFGTTPLPDDLHKWALASIDYVYKENFKLAEEEAKRISKKYPDHPAGYFFSAVALDSWMAYHQTKSKEREFYRYCDLAIEKGEQLLVRNPNDEWAKFFKGGADGYKGTYESRYERWITAFRYGWKGVSTLLELKAAKSDIVDIYYGIGNYDYWRSALIKVVWFMPGVEDRRQQGIDQLYNVRSHGVYTKITSSAALVEILINESNFKDALQISEEMLIKYPFSSVFLWGKAKALYGLKRYQESALILSTILGKMESASIDNHFRTTMCHIYHSRISLETGNYAQAVRECESINSYEFKEDIKKRLEKVLSEAANIKKQGLAKMKQ